MVVHPQGEAKALAEMCPSPTVAPIRPDHAITQLPDLGLCIFAHGSRGSGLATLGLLWKGVEPLDSGKTAMRLIKPISTLLLVAIPMAVVDPALAETRTARNGEAVIEYQIDGKGSAVLMIASLGRPASDFDELSASLVAAGYSTIRPQPRGIGGSTGPMNGLSLRDLAADAMAAADDGPIIVIGHPFG
jgi:hypothetical protein